MARPGSAVLSSADKKQQTAQLKAEIKAIDKTIRDGAKAQKELAKAAAKLSVQRMKAEAKLMALAPPSRTAPGAGQQQAA